MYSLCTFYFIHASSLINDDANNYEKYDIQLGAVG